MQVVTASTILTIGVLVGCANAPVADDGQKPKTASATSPSGSGAGQVTATIDLPATERGDHAQPNIVPGTGEFLSKGATEAPGISTSGEGGVQLSFSDTDVRQVVAYVLGDVLGLNYTIDPSIKGTLTLQTARPVSKDDLLKVLEATLRQQDIAIVASGVGYSVVPVSAATRQISALRTPNQPRAPGYGIEVVPLSYVGAADMNQLLTPLAPPGGIIRADEARNFLLIAGTGPERASMLDAIHTFDVNWLAGMSYAMYPVEYSDAKALVDELNEVFVDGKSPLNGMVRLVPLPRLNMVLVASQQSEYLQQVGDWIKRLDLGTSSPGRRIYVYDIQNGRASDVAATLNEMFGLGSGQNTSSSTSRNSGTGVRSSQSSLSSMPSYQASGGYQGGGTGLTQSNSPLSQGASSYSAPPGAAAANISLESMGLRIVTSEDSNALLIFASPSEFGVISSAIKRLDTPPLQVLIEATLAEVTLTDEIKFGVDWQFHAGGNFAGFSNASTGGVVSQYPGFNYLYTGASSIQAALNALESITKVKVISSPQLMVLNNREADIQVGDSVPILTQQAVSTTQTGAPIVNSVQQLDTGVILHVTPRVNKSGMVTLDIDQEVSSVVPTTTSSIDSPTVQERKISSSVSVNDGDCIALGGLIKENKSDSRGGLPWLSRIPVLGWLFGSTDNEHDRTELIVLITPRVVRNDADLHRLSLDLKEEFHQSYQLTQKPLDSKPADVAH